jgi:hypothetical protein
VRKKAMRVTTTRKATDTSIDLSFTEEPEAVARQRSPDFSPLRSSANPTVILDFLTHENICGIFEGFCVVWVITLGVRKSS